MLACLVHLRPRLLHQRGQVVHGQELTPGPRVTDVTNEAERAHLTAADIWQLVRAEVRERELAARDYARRGHAERAGRLRAEATAIFSVMDAIQPRVVSASREIAAEPALIFELIADPSQQPAWDGNDNLATAPAGQRVRGVGDVFTMTITRGSVRENHVTEFEEGRLIAWTPAEPGHEPPGHLWRWELTPVGPGRTRTTCTYDWTRLTDPTRLPRARSTTADRLQASLDLLAAQAEGS